MNTLLDEIIAETYGGAGTRGFEEFEILGTNDLILVTDTTPIPFRFICSLELFIPFPEDPNQVIHFIETGTLISDRHVLTAAHNVLRDLSDSGFPGVRGRAKFISVVPGRNSAVSPFGFSQSTKMRVPPQWETAANPEFDFALLTLDDALGAAKQAKLGNRPLGFWSHPQLGEGTRIIPRTINDLRNMPVNLSGYPVTNSGRQMRSSGNVVNPAPAAKPRLITYDLDETVGMRGGPVWLRWQDFRNLIAVNIGGVPNPFDPTDFIANMGVRITEDVLKQVRAWMRADGVTATF